MKTLSRDVLPQAPSPMMTSFLWREGGRQYKSATHAMIRGLGALGGRKGPPKARRTLEGSSPKRWRAYLRMTLEGLWLAMVVV